MQTEHAIPTEENHSKKRKADTEELETTTLKKELQKMKDALQTSTRKANQAHDEVERYKQTLTNAKAATRKLLVPKRMLEEAEATLQETKAALEASNKRADVAHDHTMQLQARMLNAEHTNNVLQTTLTRQHDYYNAQIRRLEGVVDALINPQGDAAERRSEY